MAVERIHWWHSATSTHWRGAQGFTSCPFRVTGAGIATQKLGVSRLYFTYCVSGIKCIPQDPENQGWDEEQSGKSVLRTTVRQLEGTEW